MLQILIAMNLSKIHPINLDFKGTDLQIFSFVVESDAGPIVIETGPHSCLPVLEEGLSKLGYAKTDVKHVLLSHIHLDHAGGAWCFAEHGAQIYLHPLGFKHTHNPEKLLASAVRIYGDMMDTLWGTLKPIPAEQLHSIEDGEEIQIGNLTFRSWHTPGHAKHHTAWQLDNVLFTGDLAGIKRPEGPVIPPCPPPDIDIELWISNIDRMLAIENIDTYYATHGSLITDVNDHMEKLKEVLIAFSEFIKPYYLNGTPPMDILAPFLEFVTKRLTAEGMTQEQIHTFVEGGALLADIHGIMRYWSKKLPA